MLVFVLITAFSIFHVLLMFPFASVNNLYSFSAVLNKEVTLFLYVLYFSSAVRDRKK